MIMPSVAIITCYHFDNSSTNQEVFQRLIRSLCASLHQLGPLDPQSRLILVANGTDDGAIAPCKVEEALRATCPAFRQDIIHACSISKNCGNTGSLNQGIDVVLHDLRGIDWIASVQSSAVIQNGWLKGVLKSADADPSVGASFGRILVEEEQDSIWTDGHILKKGLTYDANANRRINEERLCPPGEFPCLSASLFRRSLVQKIWSRYGNFVCDHLCHYGDCTDVALRARTVDPSVQFKYSETAVALKRRPTQTMCKIAASQLLAASRYYSPERRGEREDLITSNAKYSACVSYAKAEADRRLDERYSPNTPDAPRGTLLDLIW